MNRKYILILILILAFFNQKTIAKDYYEDKSFCRDENGNINLWNVYNLFTGATKSSYIDSFLERNVNAHTFTNSVSEALKGNRDYHWFFE